MNKKMTREDVIRLDLPVYCYHVTSLLLDIYHLGMTEGEMQTMLKESRVCITAFRDSVLLHELKLDEAKHAAAFKIRQLKDAWYENRSTNTDGNS